TPAATGAASTLFNTGRQLGMAVGVAILSTVASAGGLTEQVARRAGPHLAAYPPRLAAPSVIAPLAAAAARFVDDRAAAATRRRPDRSPRSTAAAAAAVSAGCHHPAASGQPPWRVPASESEDHQNLVMPAHQAGGEARHHLERRTR